MLSYQHAYHAGNLADVHKHALLAAALDYLTRKDKPLSYIETHAGRGLYDLGSVEAKKTGEAAQGIALAEPWFGPGHPYARALAAVRAAHGPGAYPGSPLIARALLRESDRLHLAELHPQEHEALREALGRARNTKDYRQDGFELAASLCPPEPRRGLMLIDPSWELKEDYARVPRVVAGLARKWNVGIIMIWYPILTDPQHEDMIAAIRDTQPKAMIHEVAFPPAREGHRMIGSGMAILNPPWGLEETAEALTERFGAI